MTQAVPYLLQGKNIILVIDGKSHTISKDTHMNYGKIVDALKAKEWDELRELVEPSKAIVDFGNGYVKIESGVVYWKDVPFNNALSRRMIEMYQDGFPIDPMVRFMENLMQNPSKRSVDQVYGFLEKNSLPITEDGHFLAYKKVRDDYKDIHSGSIDNSIGQVVEMDRNAVDDDPDSHCSTGLHFCSESYLTSFGGATNPVMILKINPADVVSIPTDYNGAKGRCMKYEVVAEVSGDPKVAFASVVDKKYAPPKNAPDLQAVWPLNSPPKNAPNPQAVWPFTDSSASAWPFPTTNTSGTVVYYTVKRKSTGDLVEAACTLDVARELVAKNVRQKKAQLIIVDSQGNEVQ